MADKVSEMTSEELFNVFVEALRTVNVGGGGTSSSSPYYNFRNAKGDSLREIFELRNEKRNIGEEKGKFSEILEKANTKNARLTKQDKEFLELHGLAIKNKKELKENTEKLTKAIDDLDQKEKSCNFGNRLVGYNNIIHKIGGALKGMDQSIMGFVNPWANVDRAASKYSKTIGATKAGLESLRKTTINNVVKSHIGIDFNMSPDELIEAQQNYVNGVGRSLRIDSKGQEALAAMHAVMGGKEQELAVAFENFGVNLEKTGEHAGKMFDEASRTGLSFEKYSDNVAKNIKIAQNYTFKNGLRGLESMAKKALALKMDMGQVASLADKISSVEGSIDVASKLQVLGGPFAAMADPLGMLNEGLLDMEGLMDRVTNMIGGLGNFDKTTGEVRVSAFNKQRIKAAAQAMGIDSSQLMESVNAQAKRKEIEGQILSSANARSLSEDMQELLKNSATFNKEGQAGVSINGDFKTLDQLTNNDYEELVKETQSESADIKDIAKNVRSLTDIRTGIRKQKEAVQAKATEKLGIGELMKDITSKVGSINGLLWALVGIKGVGALINIFSNGLDVFRMIGGKGGGISGTGRTLSNTISRGTALSGGGTGAKSLSTNVLGNGIKNGGGKAAKEAATKGGRKLGGKIGAKFGESAFGQQMGRFGATSITKVSNIGTKLSSKGYTKIGGALTKHATKQAQKYGMKNVAKMGGKRIAAKTAGKIGAKMAAGAIKGGGIGIIGAAGNIATDMLVDSGKIKKGGTAHSAMKVGSTALEGASMGAMIGSIIPGIGTAIGGAIGAVAGAAVGAVKMAKVKREMALDTQLADIGIQRKGDYGARSLKLINKALTTGELSDRMRTKLLKEGDIDLVKKIDAIKAEKEEQDEQKKDREAERQAKINSAKGEKAKSRIEKGIFRVEKAYFMGKMFNGDVNDKQENNKNLTKETIKKPLNTFKPLQFTPIGAMNSIYGSFAGRKLIEKDSLSFLNPSNLFPVFGIASMIEKVGKNHLSENVNESEKGKKTDNISINQDLLTKLVTDENLINAIKNSIVSKGQEQPVTEKIAKIVKTNTTEEENNTVDYKIQELNKTLSIFSQFSNNGIDKKGTVIKDAKAKGNDSVEILAQLVSDNILNRAFSINQVNDNSKNKEEILSKESPVNIQPEIKITKTYIKPIEEKGYNKDTTRLLEDVRNARINEYQKNRTAEVQDNGYDNKYYTGKNKETQNVNGKIDLNVSGTIKLVGANGKSADITDELLNNRRFKKELAEFIRQHFNYSKYGNDIPRTGIAV